MADLVKKLEKLARYKEGFESETDDVMKEKYKGMIEKIEKEIAEAEKEVEKQEEKVEKKEEKAMDEVAERLKKYTAMMDDADDPEVKAMYKKKIEKLKEQIGEVKEQIKEEKKELEEKKEELKEAVKEIKEAEKTIRTEAIKKAEKTQVERKEISEAKKNRRQRLRGILTDLNKLVDESDELRPKYEGKRVDLKRDAGRGSKPFGYRFKGKNNYRVPRQDQHGQPNVYYEARPNRADVKRQGSVKLADGGMMAKGGNLIKLPTISDVREHGNFIESQMIDEGYVSNAGVQEFYEYQGRKYAITTWNANSEDHNEGEEEISLWDIPDTSFVQPTITPKQVANLKKYVLNWYGAGGIADDADAEFDPPVTEDEVEIAVNQYVTFCKKNPSKWGGSDSFDREVVADIMQFNRDPQTDTFFYPSLVEEIKSTTILKKGGKTQGYDDKEDESLGMRKGAISTKDFVGTKKKREKSRRDDAEFETRGGSWAWKPEAIQNKLIPKSAMKKKPSAYYRKKYPNLVMKIK